jgi:hypothetical protein
MRHVLAALMAVVIAFAASQPALAEPKHKNKGKHKGPKIERDAGDVLLHVDITGAEVTIIYDFIRRY